MKIEEISQLSISELNKELARGAKFVQFSYTISIVVMTFKHYSNVYFIRQGDSISADRWIYTLINLIFGWWGIPFGPIYTIWSLIENAKGKDITADVISALNGKSNH